jgi:hypothetical protein
VQKCKKEYPVVVPGSIVGGSHRLLYDTTITNNSVHIYICCVDFVGMFRAKVRLKRFYIA